MQSRREKSRRILDLGEKVQGEQGKGGVKWCIRQIAQHLRRKWKEIELPDLKTRDGWNTPPRDDIHSLICSVAIARCSLISVYCTIYINDPEILETAVLPRGPSGYTAD